MSTDDLADGSPSERPRDAEAAWLEALAEHEALLHRRASGLLPAQDRRDLVQETLLIALESGRDVSRGRLLPWLLRVLRHHAYRMLRREGWRGELNEREPTVAGRDPLDLLAEREQLERARDVVRSLGEPYSSVLCERYELGWSIQRIAREHAASPATVRSQLSRGLVRLRARLAEPEDRRGVVLGMACPFRDESRATPRRCRPLVPRMRGLLAGSALIAPLVAVAWIAATPSGLRRQASGRVSPAASTSRIAPQELAATGDAPRPARRVRVASPRPGPRFVALARDERTGAPLADYSVELRYADGRRRDARTDGAGALNLEPSACDGLVACSAGDCSERSWALGGAAEPGELGAQVGPTFRLDVELPPGRVAGELRASLRGDSTFYDLRASHPWRHAPALVRGSGAPWVRFCAWYRRWTGQGDPVWLDVCSADGLLFGSAALPFGMERTGGRVRVELAAAAALAGRVLGPDGAPVDRAEVQLAPAERGAPARLVATTDAAGAYRFDGVEPGAYRVRVTALGCEPRTESLWLDAGRRIERELVLRLSAGAGELSLELVAKGGAPGPCRLRLVEERGLRGPIERWLVPPDNGASAAALDVAWTAKLLVPAGRYAISGRIGNQSSEEQLVRPGDRARLVLGEEFPVEVVRWHAHDAATGRPLERFQVAYQIEGAEPVFLPDVRAGEAAGSLPAGVPFTWGVGAPGYAPAFGTRGALRIVDGVPTGSVELSRGWGMRLQVRAAEDEAPLAGVEIRLDGEARAWTDAAGFAWLEEPERRGRPATLRAVLTGWELVPNHFFSRSGGFDDFNWFKPVLYLAPAKRGGDATLAR